MTQTVGAEAVIARCRAENRAALVAYLPVGFPDLKTSVRAMEILVEAGADIIEVGVPYSDPLMDGPVIQRAVALALERGSRVADVFTATEAVRAAGAPPLVMLYWNLVLRAGVDRFADRLVASGGGGLITPDLIPDEAAEWIAASDRTGLDRVFLVAPSSTTERLQRVTRACRGFVYAASTMGVTGARSSVGSAARDLVERTRAVTDLPVCVGLGVSTGEQAAEVGSFADGVIVGSALVAALTDREPEEGLAALRTLTEELAQGVRTGR
ncbi:Tryptophan synthase alpha chain [Nostocoides japonicum T1-X7]|uniref:Tryptophan synthase alpha chain n=1 Tax=Nostocoides japonicum T1-X7 TaxID=1194083 RepID=A0A077LWQ4_9MICO|nr:tryptophan synthase subunit alpha [Tetrasphaera japonica]CCH77257.1 Tryptophan synthase alpha chain [Tetrasphaera japonica T1-X7]